jgi:LytS/YehU family sensor histidine kinase
MGKYRLSLENRKVFETWKDSIASENHLNQIKELEVKYETDKKNQQIALLTTERELQALEARQQATWKKALIGGILLITIIAGMVILMMRQRLKTQKVLAVKNEEIKTSHFRQKLSELEMKALRAQMNPHFIFNCMNAINRMILSRESDDASRYLTKFAKLIRLMLENSENPTVSLEDELSMLEAYIQLEAMRFKGKISYQISVDEAIDQENTDLPSMVLQPFIENAIWHGLMHKEGEGFIKISITEEEHVLKCVIEDNGIGREKALALNEKSVLKRKSMGLKITEERLRLLGKAGLQQLIRITDLKDALNHALGTRVDVTIPIHN